MRENFNRAIIIQRVEKRRAKRRGRGKGGGGKEQRVVIKAGEKLPSPEFVVH